MWYAIRSENKLEGMDKQYAYLAQVGGAVA